MSATRHNNLEGLQYLKSKGYVLESLESFNNNVIEAVAKNGYLYDDDDDDDGVLVCEFVLGNFLDTDESHPNQIDDDDDCDDYDDGDDVMCIIIWMTAYDCRYRL
jgi:hypothetical protein